MTSISIELDQLAHRIAWPVRALASAARSLDPLLRTSGVRRFVKAGVDFCCGATAVVAGVAIGEGFGVFSAAQTSKLAVLVGLFLVVAETRGGSYRTIWRYTSLPEALSIGLSCAILLGALLVARSLGIVYLSAATLLLIALLILFLSVGARTMRRWSVAEAKQRERRSGAAHLALRRVLIVGAGQHGLSIGRELIAGAVPGVELIGFLDDDPAKLGAILDTVPVLGRLSDTLMLAERHQVREVIIAMPSAGRDVVRALVRQLEDVGIHVRTVGGIDRFMLGGDVHRPGTVTLHELLNTAFAPPKYHVGPGHDRRVLVTGGAGFIGSHLTRMLLDRGYHVRILDRFDYGRAGIEGLSHPRLEVIAGDICSSRDVSRALRDVHGVLALAAIVGDPACNIDPEETINLNYTATKILVEACNFYRVRRLVFASSCSVYGASNQSVLTEQSRLQPVSLYARTRVLSENILFDRAGEVEPVVLRLSTVFGLSPRMRFDLVVNTLTVRAVVDRRIAIFGGNQWRPNVHCRDAARAFISALEAPGQFVAGEIFNVGGDALNHSIAQLGDMVAEIVGGVDVTHQKDAPDPRDYRVSFEKIRRVLGFEPELTVPAGIREVAAAVRSQAALREYQNPAFHNVEALRQTFTTPRRRGSDWAPARELARA
ncbi:MAG TPA: NAD-dependent epimerase/dehydratase family protein [Gemmatimonadales bacterium]|nr:NAD-dependent epimerase/dehydratase family protein [Gemmatimonadales bacterium]